MICAATGLSFGKDAAANAESAARAAMDRLSSHGRPRADAALVFTSGGQSRLGQMLRHVQRVCGTENLAGCSGSGVLTETGEIEEEGAVAVMAMASDTLRATPFLVSDLRGRDLEAGREIGKMIEPDVSGNALVVIFPDTLSCNPDLLLSGIQDVAGEVPVVGGGSASASGSGAFQFRGEEAVSNGVSGVILTGGIVSSVGVTQSCLPVGKLWRVTDSVGNSIKSLDGLPAVRALVRCLTGPGRAVSEDLPKLARHLFVAFPATAPGAGVMERGAYFVRNILGVDPEDGAIYVGQEIERGSLISFALRDPDGAREDLKAMLQECAPLAGRPDMGLYFNCCARGRGLYGLPDIDTAYIRNAFAQLPLAGFFGYAEIAPLKGRARLHNYSGVMLLVSEAPSAPSTC